MSFLISSPIHKAWRQFKLHLDHLMSDRDCSADEAHAICFIARYGPVTMGEVGRVLGIKASTLTSMVDRLEKSGYVIRQIDPQNRRQVIISCKKKGDEFAQEGWAVLETIEKEIRSRVSTKELEGFHAVINAIETVLQINVREKK